METMTEIGTELKESLEVPLLDKVSGLAASFCAGKGDCRYVLENVRVTKDYTEATDGHVLVRIDHAGMPLGEFPISAGVKNCVGDALINGEALSRAIKGVGKGRLPILECVRYGETEGGEKVIVSFNKEIKETRTVIGVEEEEGPFPKTEVLMDKVSNNMMENPAKSFTFNVEQLGRIVALAKGMKGERVSFSFSGGESDPAVFEVKAGDRKAVGLVMGINARG